MVASLAESSAIINSVGRFDEKIYAERVHPGTARPSSPIICGFSGLGALVLGKSRLLGTMVRTA
jgi:hypothetical protein